MGMKGLNKNSTGYTEQKNVNGKRKGESKQKRVMRAEKGEQEQKWRIIMSWINKICQVTRPIQIYKETRAEKLTLLYLESRSEGKEIIGF